MNDNELQLLKSSVDKVVKIHCSDGFAVWKTGATVRDRDLHALSFCLTG